MLLLDYGSNFKDEIVATALVLVVTAIGSFYFIDQLLSQQSQNTNQSQILGLQTESTTTDSLSAPETSNTLPSPQPTSTPTATTSPTPSPTLTPSPTITPAVVEIPYGGSQQFENNDYILSFTDPRLIVSSSQIFKVNVVLKNKKVEGDGLSNNLNVTIVKDGSIVSDSVPMSISETVKIKVGEQITYTASLSMIQGTDITKITFVPTGGPLASTYSVNPQ